MFAVRYSKRALKALRKAEAGIAAGIMAKIDQLAADPFAKGLDTKRLQGRDGYRLRVGEWRVLHDLDTKAKSISIEDIADRKDAYK